MRGLVVTTFCLATLVVSQVAQGEIRAVTDRHGRYVMTRVLVSAGPSVWSPSVRTNPALVLNSEGAERGDLWPTIAEHRRNRTAWVVWSLLDENRYKMVWSRWLQSGWNDVLPLETRSASGGDDLDPDMGFDVNGRPFVVWWRDDGSTGEILLSVWMGNAWMPVFRVSDVGVDSRYPSIRVESEHTLWVTYTTPEGLLERSVHFVEPVTITDDINPLNHLTIGASHHIQGD